MTWKQADVASFAPDATTAAAKKKWVDAANKAMADGAKWQEAIRRGNEAVKGKASSVSKRPSRARKS